MMNSWTYGRIQDQSRGKSLTGEGVPWQRTMNEQVRRMKNTVNIELWVLKRGLGVQLRVIHVHIGCLRALMHTFMALWPCFCFFFLLWITYITVELKAK